LNDQDPTTPRTRPPELPEIAKWVLGISGLAILLTASISLWGAYRTSEAQFSETSQLVFNSLLPLLGTWVGTVLAYYFSKTNFETASNSVERMVTLTTEQRLRQLSVDKEMLRPADIKMYRLPSGKSEKDVPLKDLLALLGGKITRIPITDEKNVVRYILHQSGLYRFVAEQAIAGKTAAEVDKLTLQDLVDDAELKNWVTNIAYVPEQASVADAKLELERRQGCQDLIVTPSGKKDEPMVGWMTNVDIGRLSKA
jgi:hypothetical protein